MGGVPVAEAYFRAHQDRRAHFRIGECAHVSGGFGIDRFKKPLAANTFGKRKTGLDQKRQYLRGVTGICQNETVPFMHALVLGGRHRRKGRAASKDAGHHKRFRNRHAHGISQISAERDYCRALDAQMLQKTKRVCAGFSRVVDFLRQLRRMAESSANDGDHPNFALFCRRLRGDRPADHAIVKRKEDHRPSVRIAKLNPVITAAVRHFHALERNGLQGIGMRRFPLPAFSCTGDNFHQAKRDAHQFALRAGFGLGEN